MTIEASITSDIYIKQHTLNLMYKYILIISYGVILLRQAWRTLGFKHRILQLESDTPRNETPDWNQEQPKAWKRDRMAKNDEKNVRNIE